MSSRPTRIVAALVAALAGCGLEASRDAASPEVATAAAVSAGLLDVTWTVEPAGCGSVTSTGLFIAPAAPATCQVRATSRSTLALSAAGTVSVTAAPAGGLCGAAAGQLFPPGAPWNTPVDQAPLDAESGAIIAFLAANHTASSRFQIAFDFNTLRADGATTRRSFTRTGDFFSPDCDPAAVPVPPGGRLEAEASYACASDGDCHLTVIDEASCRLYEMWRANIIGGTATGTFYGGCLAVWDLASVPPASGRGEYCTSADAAGLPILPLVFDADEVAVGTIEHAIRFILPGNLIRRFVYVHPGTHSTSATTGGPAAPPYGARLRLKASKDLTGLTAGAQVVARALQRYGMFLADQGNLTFTAASDALTAHTWAGVGMSSSSLRGLSWNDFEVVELGPRIDWNSGSCSRTPIAD